MADATSEDALRDAGVAVGSNGGVGRDAKRGSLHATPARFVYWTDRLFSFKTGVNRIPCKPAGVSGLP